MYHFYRHRQKYLGALVLLGVELFFGIIGALLLFFWYDEITVSAGDVEMTVPILSTKLLSFTPAIVQITGEDISYSGMFGSMYIGNKTQQESLFHHKTMILKNINIDHEKLNRFLICKQFYDQGDIDGHMALYLFRASMSGFQDIITDRNLLSTYTNAKLLVPIMTPIQSELDQYQKLIQQEQYDVVLRKLQVLDQVMRGMQQDNKQILTLNLVRTKEFLYLIDKLHRDISNVYAPDIALARDVFGINPNLIKAAILTEQLRGFFTYRGVVKQIIASQKYMMIMQQSSRGIGGVKEKTAKQIEDWLGLTYPNVYRKYIAFTTSDPNHITQERYARLTSTHDYFYQIIYVAGNLAMNIMNWQQAGIDIHTKPGVVLTLYNIGSRPPHKNPEIGGATLSLAGQKMTFGSVGMFLYYWLDVYG